MRNVRLSGTQLHGSQCRVWSLKSSGGQGMTSAQITRMAGLFVSTLLAISTLLLPSHWLGAPSSLHADDREGGRRGGGFLQQFEHALQNQQNHQNQNQNQNNQRFRMDQQFNPNF